MKAILLIAVLALAIAGVAIVSIRLRHSRRAKFFLLAAVIGFVLWRATWSVEALFS